MRHDKFDIHQHITDTIVAAIENGAGQWQMPWHRGSGGKAPVNVASTRRYRGVNVLALWVEAQTRGYSSHIWGTFRQWSDNGAIVKKGQKAAYVVFYREIETATTEDDESDSKRRLVARATPVFNADQVDRGDTPTPTETISTVASVDQLVTATGASIVHGGSRACYVPGLDQIQMPPPASFFGSPTSSPTEAYYSTLLHELTHWTAPVHRCGRDLKGRFGSEEYAMEELVAELGAAFLCGDFGLCAEPRADHAQYLAHWLNVLRADKRAIFTAASKADQAVRFLQSLAGTQAP
jgi:antirestriction protein ArdC